MTVRISITDAPVFAGIKKKERQLVDSLATEVDMDAGSTIFEQGGGPRSSALSSKVSSLSCTMAKRSPRSALVTSSERWLCSA